MCLIAEAYNMSGYFVTSLGGGGNYMTSYMIFPSGDVIAMGTNFTPWYTGPDTDSAAIHSSSKSERSYKKNSCK